ncbi:hypothetical protein [Cohnella sp. GCM10027633]|uniref:hypothetical protein n=1 Tax=unclassified Cohnella TaxID=2636738 RepID=UPI003626BC3F
MSFEEFNWDSKAQCVSWLFEGILISSKYQDAYLASVDIVNQHVIVEAGKNYSQDQVYFLTTSGEQIFKLDKINNIVLWKLQNQSVELSCNNILNGKFYVQHRICIVISIENDSEVLKGFALDGTLLFINHPPKGFKLIYLSTYNGQPSVVCDADEVNSDQFGRNRWHLIINKITGALVKADLAY